jgi:hypothetical protein
MINDDNSTVINQNYSAVVNKGLDTLPTSETFHDVYNKCCFSMQHHGNSGAKCLVSLFNVGFSKSAQQILPEEVSTGAAIKKFPSDISQCPASISVQYIKGID